MTRSWPGKREQREKAVDARNSRWEGGEGHKPKPSWQLRDVLLHLQQQFTGAVPLMSPGRQPGPLLDPAQLYAVSGSNLPGGSGMSPSPPTARV